MDWETGIDEGLRLIYLGNVVPTILTVPQLVSCPARNRLRFLSLSTIHILSWISLHRGGYPVHCQYLAASSLVSTHWMLTASLVVTTKNTSRHCQILRPHRGVGDKITPVENHWNKWIASFKECSPHTVLPNMPCPLGKSWAAQRVFCRSQIWGKLRPDLEA